MTTPDSDTALAEQLLRFTRRVHRIQKRHIEQCGLGVTPAQSRLLRTLACYSSPPRMADLAERLEVVPRAVTTLVDGLEAADGADRAAGGPGGGGGAARPPDRVTAHPAPACGL
ncbi:hypothetical protein ACWD25_08810, partial [Streptomyces sp. NPDC002920]